MFFDKKGVYKYKIVFSGDNTKVYIRVPYNTKFFSRKFVFSSDNTKVYFRIYNNTTVL